MPENIYLYVTLQVWRINKSAKLYYHKNLFIYIILRTASRMLQAASNIAYTQLCLNKLYRWILSTCCYLNFLHSFSATVCQKQISREMMYFLTAYSNEHFFHIWIFNSVPLLLFIHICHTWISNSPIPPTYKCLDMMLSPASTDPKIIVFIISEQKVG